MKATYLVGISGLSCVVSGALWVLIYAVGGDLYRVSIGAAGMVAGVICLMAAFYVAVEEGLIWRR